MSSVNKVILIGNAGKDPDVRYTQDGTAVATVSIATSETWKGKDGEKKEQTEWHRVVFWDRLGEIVGEYVKKGSKVYVEGKLQTRKYVDKDGADRYTTEIRAERLQLLSARQDGDSQERPAPKPQQRPQRQDAGTPEYMDDDIPF